MVESNTPKAAPDQQTIDRGHEGQTTHVKAMLAITAGLLLTVVVFGLGVQLFGFVLEREIPDRSDRNAYDQAALPAKAADWADPPKDLSQYRRTQQKRLEGYGWIDQKAGVVRIPIERAMRLEAQKSKQNHPSQTPSEAEQSQQTSLKERIGPQLLDSRLRGNDQTAAVSYVANHDRHAMIRLIDAGGEPTSEGDKKNPNARTGPEGKVKLVQNLGTTLPMDVPFTDDQGNQTTLNKILTDRPALLMLGYYHCPQLCDVVLANLARSLKQVDFDPGNQFEIVMISIDPRDTTRDAAKKKRKLLKAYNREKTADGWHFLTGPQTSIDKTAKALGYYYTYLPNRDQYAHPAAVMAVTPQGRVSRYLLGMSVASRDLRLALMDASNGDIGTLADKVLQCCFLYNPKTGKYGKDIFFILQASGVLTTVVLITLIGVLLWRHRRTSGRSANRPVSSDPHTPPPPPSQSPPGGPTANPQPPQAVSGPLLFAASLGLSLFPDTATNGAWNVDYIFFAMLGFSALVTLTLIFLVVTRVWRYREGSEADRSGEEQHEHLREIVWMIAFFIVGLGVFLWAGAKYFEIERPPNDAKTVYIVGKQWMWKSRYPGGQEEINALHVPKGESIKLVMTSQDVIHSFYVPAFRVKQDVLPNKYTTLWFKANKTGTFDLNCAEYCGSGHSQMRGKVIVMKPAAFQRWLGAQTQRPEGAIPGTPGTESAPMALEVKNARTFERYGCVACHVPDSKVRAPRLDGLFGHNVRLSNGQQIVADEQYIRESILRPQAKITASYPEPSLMPTYEGQVNEEELRELIGFIKSIKEGWPEDATGEDPARYTKPESESESEGGGSGPAETDRAAGQPDKPKGGAP